MVTGGAGFIGGAIAIALSKNSHQVTVVDDLSTGHKERLEEAASAIAFEQGDIQDHDLMRTVCAGAEYIIHQAAIRAVGRSIENPLGNHAVNLTATLDLLHISQEVGAKRFIFASSSAVYGNAYSDQQKETFLPHPQSPYAVTKIAAEYYAYVWSQLYGVDTVSLRYFNVYGPHQNPESDYSAVIPIFIERLLQGKSAEIHGQGTQRRDFVYIADVVQAVLQAVAAPKPLRGQALNIGSGQHTSVANLYSMLAQIIGEKVPPTYGPRRAGDVNLTYADITAAQQVLGYRPTVSLADGLEQTVDWFRVHQGRMQS